MYCRPFLSELSELQLITVHTMLAWPQIAVNTTKGGIERGDVPGLSGGDLTYNEAVALLGYQLELMLNSQDLYFIGVQVETLTLTPTLIILVRGTGRDNQIKSLWGSEGRHRWTKQHHQLHRPFFMHHGERDLDRWESRV